MRLTMLYRCELRAEGTGPQQISELFEAAREVLESRFAQQISVAGEVIERDLGLGAMIGDDRWKGRTTFRFDISPILEPAPDPPA